MSSTLSEQVAELEAERDELKERDKDPRIEAWNEIADHPFFEGAYDTEDTLLGTMLARLDAAMEPAQPTVPRVITIDELKSWQCVAVGHNGHWRIIEMGDHIEEIDRAETLDYFAIYPGDSIVLLEDAPAEEPEPVKVGDTINTEEELDSLPSGSVVLDHAGDAQQKDDAGEWWETAISDGRGPVDVARYAPLTILHLPEEDA